MAASGVFSGPVVLLGISLSPEDEPVFLRALDRLGSVMGSVPFAAMRQMMGSVTKNVASPKHAERSCSMTSAAMIRRSCASSSAATCSTFAARTHPNRLGDAGVPAWIVHAQKGDGGLTHDERRALEACPNTRVDHHPPAPSFFLPNEEPARIAEIVAGALGRDWSTRQRRRDSGCVGGVRRRRASSPAGLLRVAVRYRRSASKRPGGTSPPPARE